MLTTRPPGFQPAAMNRQLPQSQVLPGPQSLGMGNQGQPYAQDVPQSQLSGLPLTPTSPSMLGAAPPMGPQAGPPGGMLGTPPPGMGGAMPGAPGSPTAMTGQGGSSLPPPNTANLTGATDPSLQQYAQALSKPGQPTPTY